MTPDLKRLCEAASNIDLDAEPGWLRDDDAEKVVRAVLAALREPSESLKQVAGQHTVEFNDVSYDVTVETCGAFTAMIDHVLGEPVTA